jgi:Fe/S biogenesis protein NfuA
LIDYYAKEVIMDITLNQIESVLDAKVRPSLAVHGGNVIVKGLEDDVLKVKLTGKCSGCPAAHSTNEELISLEICQAFPSIRDIILVEETSPELIDMAHKILNHQL